MKRLWLSLATLPLIGAGCISFGSTGKTGVDGGVYRSPDKGITWEHKVALPGPKGVGSIAAADATTIVQDPSDRKALYLGTAANGLLYSFDGGESWRRATDLAAGRVTAIAVHPRAKCTIYVATGVRIMRTTDCNRTYQAVYVDTRPDAFVTALAIDYADPRRIYGANSAGDLLRSPDEGTSWAPIRRFDDKVSALLVSRRDPRIIMVALKGKGIFRSTDAGTTWTDQKSALDPFPGARTFAALVEDQTASGSSYIHASRFGLLRTTDGGANWQKLNLLTPPESTTIYSLAANPTDGKEIYYGTANTLYKSFDGGGSWSTKRLPTTRAATVLLVDQENGNLLYLGATKLQK